MTDSITALIVEEVAEREECDPADLQPLHFTVDTEAIEALHGDAQIVFRYEGYVVSVDHGSGVRVFRAARNQP